VTRTSRLVRYNLVHDMLSAHAGTGRGFEVVRAGAGHRIVVHAVHDDLFGAATPTIEDLRGITFYCDDPETTGVWIAGREVARADLQVNGADHTGRRSIGVRWHEVDTLDYSASFPCK
jgi:hypothetical protein